MDKQKLLHAILFLLIVLFSAISSYLIVFSQADFATDVKWYIHLFFGDKNYYYFNIIPMTVWAFVQIVKFVLSFSCIVFVLLMIKRYITQYISIIF